MCTKKNTSTATSNSLPWNNLCVNAKCKASKKESLFLTNPAWLNYSAGCGREAGLRKLDGVRNLRLRSWETTSLLEDELLHFSHTFGLYLSLLPCPLFLYNHSHYLYAVVYLLFLFHPSLSLCLSHSLSFFFLSPLCPFSPSLIWSRFPSRPSPVPSPVLSG